MEHSRHVFARRFSQQLTGRITIVNYSIPRHTKNTGDKMTLLPSSLSLLAALSITAAAQAQTYPNRLITLIAPYAAGGDSDLAGRNLAAAAAKLDRKSVV